MRSEMPWVNWPGGGGGGGGMNRGRDDKETDIEVGRFFSYKGWK